METSGPDPGTFMGLHDMPWGVGLRGWCEGGGRWTMRDSLCKNEEAGSLYRCGQEGLLPFLLFPGIARVLCVWDPLALVGSTLGDPFFTWLT